MKLIRFFVMTILGWLCSLSLWAYDFEVGGLYYTLTSLENLEVEVSKGNWGDWNDANEKYKGNIVIPETVFYKGKDFQVIGIGYGAFANCNGLVSVDLGNVKTIGYGAFADCYNLKSVDFGNVQTIGEDAFRGCRLDSLDFKNVRTIGNGAFRDCSSLSFLDFKNVQMIGEAAFSECSGLTTITLAETNAIYSSPKGCNALIETATNTLILGCKTTVIPNNVHIIGNGAFSNCTGLTSVDLSNIHTIGNGAFSNCTGLTSVDLSNIHTLGNDAFSNCTGLTSVDLSNINTIGDGVFFYCTNLTSVDFGNVRTIGDSAFRGCSHLKSIDFKNVQTIGDNAFRRCYNNMMGDDLTSIDFKNVQTIGKNAFTECSGLKSIDLKNVQSIGELAFNYCYRLASIKTSEMVPPILSNSAFDDDIYSSARLEVPVGCIDSYRQAQEWYKFFCIIEVPDIPSAVTDVDVNPVSVKGLENHLVIEGANAGDRIMIYTAEGTMVASEISNGQSHQISLEPGHVYIVKVGTRTFKVGL